MGRLYLRQSDSERIRYGRSSIACVLGWGNDWAATGWRLRDVRNARTCAPATHDNDERNAGCQSLAVD